MLVQVLTEAYDGARGHWTATQRRVRWFLGDGEDAISSVSSAFFVSRLRSFKGSDRGIRRCSWTLWTVTQRRVWWFPGDGEDAVSSVSSAFFVSRLRSFKGSDRGIRRCSWTLWTVTQRRVRWFPGDGGGSGLLMPSGSLMPSLASEYQQDGDVHKGIADGEGSKNIKVAQGVKEKEQGNKPTFKRTLRIFVEAGGKRRVQWELERQAIEEPSKKGVPLTIVARVSMQVKQDGRLLCWVPRAQSQVHQGSSVQETNVMKCDVGVQTENDEIVVLGDVRGVVLAGMGEKGTKVGEGVPRSAPCKGKAKMDAQDNTIVTLRDPSSSAVTKRLEPETDSSSSEAEEGEFLDEASIISFFDNEEGMASLLEMDGGEGDIRAPFFPMASIDGEITFCKDKGTKHVSVNLLSNEVKTAPLPDNAQKQLSSSDLAYTKTNVASRVLSSGDHFERHELMEVEGNSSDDSCCDKYLAQAADFLTSECIIALRFLNLKGDEPLLPPFTVYNYEVEFFSLPGCH
ncbi:dicer-like protein 4 isoform X3 [Senna tora]|uniref:Dicer-like protein 4 isoform X3 n=1 Tax=Senna tora TaxID=362788 RepID=A0A835CEC4_9FABA|nr:dicer-like protein 4 isoform X3 [Senna tora]